jgi:hypothetical protein
MYQGLIESNVPNFENKEEFIEYLKETLIPDLECQGFNQLGEDFREAIYWMTGEKQ